jgi:protein SCO1/2
MNGVGATRRTYGIGLSVVACAVGLAFLVSFATVGARPSGPPPRAAADLGASAMPLGDFRLTERSGRAVGSAELADDVWIAAFIFTRCPSSCPRISSVMKGLQGKLAGTGVRLVSISVDPARDTPEVLARYADALGADPNRWWFLTGPKPAVYELILERFHVPVRDASEAERAAGAEDVAHSAKLALVDRGNRVVGYFDAESGDEVADLVARARRLDNVWAHLLPTLNATLNGLCAVVLVLAWAAIRAGRVRLHAAGMVAALVLSALFLASYLLYHFVVVRGSMPFRGVGRPIRVAYFTILLSHTALAIATVPLVALTVLRAARRRFDRHVPIASLTLPIWLYVSITGVVVYLMLYRLDFSALSTTPMTM